VPDFPGLFQSEDELPNQSPRPKGTGRKPAPALTRKPGSAAVIFETLRARIAQQNIAPGAKLNEMDLSEEFGVSRARVRDALGALEQRGLVERIPNRGAVVMRLDLSQVFHIYDIREVLEGLAARLATQNTSPGDWKEDLASFQRPLKVLIDRGDLQEYIEHYERLRRRIIVAARNPVLAEMLDTIFEKTQVLIRRIIILPGRAEVGRKQHVAMLEAMCRGEAEKAEKIRRNGLRSARRALEKYQRFIL